LLTKSLFGAPDQDLDDFPNIHRESNF
jgi:hypothetical protein